VALGALSAHAGGSSRRRSALRMLFWGDLAMGLTGPWWVTCLEPWFEVQNLHPSSCRH
jgi:hypothetical protein